MTDTKIPPMMPTEKSSNIKAIGYDEPSRTMHIQFKSGGHYSYANLPPEAHKAFMEADSHGGYFAKKFAGKYEHTKLA